MVNETLRTTATTTAESSSGSALREASVLPNSARDNRITMETPHGNSDNKLPTSPIPLATTNEKPTTTRLVGRIVRKKKRESQWILAVRELHSGAVARNYGIPRVKRLGGNLPEGTDDPKGSMPFASFCFLDAIVEIEFYIVAPPTSAIDNRNGPVHPEGGAATTMTTTTRTSSKTSTSFLSESPRHIVDIRLQMCAPDPTAVQWALQQIADDQLSPRVLPPIHLALQHLQSKEEEEDSNNKNTKECENAEGMDDKNTGSRQRHTPSPSTAAKIILNLPQGRPRRLAIARLVRALHHYHDQQQLLQQQQRPIVPSERQPPPASDMSVPESASIQTPRGEAASTPSSSSSPAETLPLDWTRLLLVREEPTLANSQHQQRHESSTSPLALTTVMDRAPRVRPPRINLATWNVVEQLRRYQEGQQSALSTHSNNGAMSSHSPWQWREPLPVDCDLPDENTTPLEGAVSATRHANMPDHSKDRKAIHELALPGRSAANAPKHVPLQPGVPDSGPPSFSLPLNLPHGMDSTTPSFRGNQTRTNYILYKKLPQVAWMVQRLARQQETDGTKPTRPIRHVLDVGGGRGDLAMGLITATTAQETHTDSMSPSLSLLLPDLEHVTVVDRNRSSLEAARNHARRHLPTELHHKLHFACANLADILATATTTTTSTTPASPVSMPLERSLQMNFLEEPSDFSDKEPTKLPPVDCIVALHSCGDLSDGALFLAQHWKSVHTFVVCPCCYTKTHLYEQVLMDQQRRQPERCISVTATSDDRPSFAPLWWQKSYYRAVADKNKNKQQQQAQTSQFEEGMNKTASSKGTASSTGHYSVEGNQDLYDDHADFQSWCRSMGRLAELDEEPSLCRLARIGINSMRLERLSSEFEYLSLEEYSNVSSGRNLVLVGTRAMEDT